MSLTRAMLDPAMIQLAALALGGTILAARNVPAAYRTRPDGWSEPRQLLTVVALATLLALVATDRPVATLAVALAATMGIVALRIALPRLSIAGAIQLAVPLMLPLVAAPWSYLLMRDLGFPGWALGLSLAGMAIGMLLLGFGFAGNLARQAIVTHRSWRRPVAPLAPFAGRLLPKVSIQLPCYAEPPHVVIATIDRLAALDYPHFEVMVCDNNTADEALWRPLEAHCRRLNVRLGFERFRFFHVDALPGAKAGALNFCLDRMARDADLVAVIDADYQSRPDFLSRLVGFFDDPAIGYLQTPHDYREVDNAYLRGCYWEYMPSNKIDMAGVHEYAAPFTIGTMCLIRTAGLRAAGGWAEWCLTEDSEVSIRLRTLGYRGIYLRETFGRGLIPATFEDYKKQRFRWTAGPVQQLRRYWRLFLPAPFGGSALNGWSKLLEFQRSASPLATLFGTGLGLVAGTALATLTIVGTLPVIVLPSAAWTMLLLGLATTLVATWHRQRLSGCTRIRDMLGGEIARASLAWVMMSAALAGLSSRPLAWRRTPKFAMRGSASRAISAALPETLIGIAHLALLAALIAWSDAVGGHFALLAGVGLALSSLRFFAAPAMAFLGERNLARAAPRRRETIESIAAEA